MEKGTPLMSQSPAAQRYDWLAQVLHWAMAAILVYLIVTGSFEDVPDNVMEQKIQLHSGLGLMIIVLGLIRWGWRFFRPKPETVVFEKKWQKTIAVVIHQAFYALFLIAPALGVLLATLVAYPVRPFGFSPIYQWPENSPAMADLVNSFHGFAADVIMVLLIVHAGAALYHHFIQRNSVMLRMLPRI